MSLQREILSPVTTAGILYPALHTQVLQIAMPKEIDNPKSINSSINIYNEMDEVNFGYHGVKTILSAIQSDRVQILAQYICSKCGQVFINKKVYAGHISGHGKIRHRYPINCKICEKEFLVKKSAVHKRKYCSIKCRDLDEDYKKAERGFHKGNIPWNKGLTKEDPKINEWSKKLCKPKKVTEKVLSFRKQKKEKYQNGQLVVWNKGLHGKEYLSHYKNGNPNAKNPSVFKTTKPEKVLFSALKKENISFKDHYGINLGKEVSFGFYTNADCAIPKKKIAIYVDGEYWHSLPGAPERDKEVSETLTKCGWRVLRFSDKTIYKNLADVLEQIKNELIG